MNRAECDGRTAGYVLVGGNSSRMGQNKAMLTMRGRPLAEFVARAVEEATGSVTLVGDPATYAALGLRVIPDAFPGEGPLGGILTALRDSQAEWNLLMACDMPATAPEFLRKLVEIAKRTQFDALVPVGPSGKFQPLCAVYHARSLAGLEAAFSAGIRKVATALERVQTLPFPVMEAQYFQNLNTPDEWAAYAAK